MPETVMTAVPASHLRPLCVDLDGSLVKSDTLFDALCLFLRNDPLEVWRWPAWLAAGRARLKLEVARRAQLDATRLPYNRELLNYLQEERRQGRPIYLATGADGGLAERVAAHLGIFSGVLASDGTTNLTHERKLDRLKRHFKEFDYVGNSGADLPMLENAQEAMVANPTRGLQIALKARGIHVSRTFSDRQPLLRTVLKTVRLHQWAKNLLVFVPLLLSHKLTPASIGAAIAAFFCFSFVASANYVVNDLLDIESDRRHPSKRMRPFAAGDMPIAGGALIIGLLALAAALLLPFVTREFFGWMIIYIACTMAYSFYLKSKPVIDVLLLSGLYTVRMMAGGAATGTEISQWLASFSSFLFLSLAMVKRCSELENMRERGVVSSPGRGYRVGDLDQMRSFGTASAYAAVLVFMLYIARPDVTALYGHATRLWLIVPLLLYWIHRVWLLASRGELNEDPVIFAIRDRMSLAVGVGVLIVAALAL